MSRLWATTLVIVSLCIRQCQSRIDDTYEEHLAIDSLGNGLLHAKFDFVTTTDHSTLLNGHFNLFPKSLGEIIRKYHIQELDLSLTQGIWRYPIWGIPSHGSANPSGASLLAIFEESVSDVNREWKGLVNSLAGMTCASLNFIDETNSVSPLYTLYPQGAIRADKPFQNSLLRYAVLAQENVCTENLTPFKKLLPCVGRAGLSAFLAAKPLFDSHYNSISLTVRPMCSNKECTQTHLELRQSVSTVLNYFSHGSPQKEWSVRSLFGARKQQNCHLASKSDINLNVPASATLVPNPVEEKRRDDRLTARYEFTDKIRVLDDVSAKFVPRPKPSLYAHRYMGGYGQEQGKLVCEITNGNEEPVQIVYTEYIPWYLRVYLHTLTIKNSNRDIAPKKVRAYRLNLPQYFAAQLYIGLVALNMTSLAEYLTCALQLCRNSHIK